MRARDRSLRIRVVATLMLSAVSIASAAGPVARTAQGPVEGATLADGTRVWRAIPYAAPPVGARRWRAPAPARAWSGVRPATGASTPCTQPYTDPTGGSRIVGSEDCLTLDVYAPAGPTRPRRPRPVMLWIHGGGQMYGTGASYDGSRLAARHDVVVVTINYRLGPFGWFHHPAITGAGAGRTSGQYALLDMIAALRWVRANIAAFGGDASNVTIFGESAGAQNVYALLLAPRARGLYARAIAQSGGFWNMTLEQAVNYRDAPVPGTALSAREVVNLLLIDAARATDATAARTLQEHEAPARLAHWLRALPPAALLAPYLRNSHADYDLPSVVYDGVALPRADHRALIAAGLHAPVPMLIGGNHDEQKLYLYADPGYTRRDGNRLVVRDAARYETVNHLYSAWWNYMAVDDLLDRVRTPVYAYSFEWSDEPREPTDLHALYGAAHGLELAFVFGDFRASFVHDELPGDPAREDPADPLSRLFDEHNRGSRERVSDAMMSYWAEFARHGAPGRGTDGALPEWRAWRQSRSKLVFDEQPPRLRAGRLDGEALLAEIWSAPGLDHAERCSAFLDATMYPRYRLAELAAHGCAR